jgi:hypothetical protein
MVPILENGTYFKWNFIKVATNPEKGNKVKNIAWKELLVKFVHLNYKIK